MAKPFDATTKRLLELDPAGWLACVGLPITGPVRAVNSDLSTVTAEVDTIIQVGEPADYLAHPEIQSGHDLALPRRLLHSIVLLNYRHQRPVRSVAVLLIKAADSPSLNGHHRVLLPEGTSYLDFRYSVVRVRKLGVEQVLQSGLGILPLAPLAKFNKKDVRSVINRMKWRLDREVSQEEAGLRWSATQVLMALKDSEEFTETLLQRAQGMEESVTYQAIIRRGIARGSIQSRREELLLIGNKRFGSPDDRIVEAVNRIEDDDRLKRLMEKLLDVTTWDELVSIL